MSSTKDRLDERSTGRRQVPAPLPSRLLPPGVLHRPAGTTRHSETPPEESLSPPGQPWRLAHEAPRRPWGMPLTW
jgi:hypothetical protein